jgi:probable phosphoglycerate mutase
VNRSPAGAGGTTGSSLPLDRELLASRLGFYGVIPHARDAMWQADGFVDLLATLASVAVEAGQVAADLEIWASPAYGFIGLADEYCRVSALMPQKKNPYALSVIRHAGGSAAGALAALLGLPVRLDDRLREHGLGSWEGLTRDEVAARHPDQYEDWLAGRPVPGRGGEAQADVAARAVAVVADLPLASTAVLVTHGGTAGRLVEALLGLGPEHRRVFGPLGNCHWSELSHQGTGWRLMRHNLSVPAPGQEGSRRAWDDRGRLPGPSATDVPDALRSGAPPEEGAPAPVSDADAAG